MNSYRYEFFPQWVIEEIGRERQSVTIEACIAFAEEKNFLRRGTVRAHSAEDAMTVMRVDYNPFGNRERTPVFTKIQCIDQEPPR